MDRPVSANHTIADVLARVPAAARVFLTHRMSCVGCAIAPFETLADACAIYRVPIEQLLNELDAAPQERTDNT